MDFSDIFLPIFGALVAHSISMEIIGMLLQWWFSKKQAKAMAEVEQKLANGEINPMDLMGGQFGMPGMPSFPKGAMRHPTASGNAHTPATGDDDGTGQYL